MILFPTLCICAFLTALMPSEFILFSSVALSVMTVEFVFDETKKSLFENLVGVSLIPAILIMVFVIKR